MIAANEQAIRQVVEEVLAQLGKKSVTRATTSTPRNGDWGVFNKVDDAVAAANDAFQKLRERPVADRAAICELVKSMCNEHAEEWGTKEMNETKIGRLDHKIEKLKIVKLVPGVEWLRTDAKSGDHGLTITEYAPFGVIGACPKRHTR